MGAVVSELLADALARRRPRRRVAAFHWSSRAMNARVNLADTDELYAALDADRS